VLGERREEGGRKIVKNKIGFSKSSLLPLLSPLLLLSSLFFSYDL
jgi:hypothetical protein